MFLNRPKNKILFTVLLTVFTLCHTSASHSIRPNEPGPWPAMQVNTYTGNFFYQRNDLYIPIRGEIPLDIYFTYNSLKHLHDNGYGSGWSFSYGMNYKFSGNNIIIIREDGKEDLFTWNGTDYDPPTRIYDDLLLNTMPANFS